MAAWVAMTALFSFAAWQVVQIADAATNDSPSAPVVAAFGGPASTTSLDLPTPSSTIPEPIPTTTSTVEADDESSPTPINPTTRPGATIPSTETPNPDMQTRIIETRGGTLSVSYGHGEVHFKSASATIGWTVEVKDAGPNEVDIKFEQGDVEIDVKVEWNEGELVVDVDEESDD